MEEYLSLPELVKKAKYSREYEYRFNQDLNRLVLVSFLRGIGECSLAFAPGYVELGLSKVNSMYSGMDFSCGINREVLLLDSFNSATIEGARTTIDSVKSCLCKSVKSRDDLMVINVFKAIQYMIGSGSICEDSLLKEWSIITEGVCENLSKQGSKYRSEMVYVGNESKVIHTPELPENIGGCMQSMFMLLFLDLDTIIKAVVAHFYIVYIHPFCDGNNRLARLFMQEVLYKLGYSGFIKVPIISVINQNLSGYYKGIELSESVFSLQGRRVLDITPFILYMLNILSSSLKEYFSMSIHLSSLEKGIIQKMKKYGSGAEITIKKVSKLFNVTRHDASSALDSLVAKGMLFKYTSGCMNIYRLY